MCRTVTDAAICSARFTGVDPRDSATNAGSGRSFADYTKSLDVNGLKGARIGVHRKAFGFSDAVDKVMKDSIDIIKTRGATVVDPADIPTQGKFDDSELEVLLYEFKADLNAYLASLGPRAPVKSLKEIIDFNEQYRDREMPLLWPGPFDQGAGQRTFDREGLSRRARQESSADPQGRHRFCDG
jgi:amidase